MMEMETTVQSEKKLAERGWLRRFSAEEPRLSEMKELYESLGLEVLIVPGVTPDEEGCAACFDVPDFQDRYYTLYTRGNHGSEHRGPGELFD